MFNKSIWKCDVCIFLFLRKNLGVTNLEVKPDISFVWPPMVGFFISFLLVIFHAQIMVVFMSAFSGSTINKGYPFDSGVLETFDGCGSTGQLLFFDFF